MHADVCGIHAQLCAMHVEAGRRPRVLFLGHYPLKKQERDFLTVGEAGW